MYGKLALSSALTPLLMPWSWTLIVPSLSFHCASEYLGCWSSITDLSPWWFVRFCPHFISSFRSPSPSGYSASTCTSLFRKWAASLFLRIPKYPPSSSSGCSRITAGCFIWPEVLFNSMPTYSQPLELSLEGWVDAGQVRFWNVSWTLFWCIPP